MQFGINTRHFLEALEYFHKTKLEQPSINKATPTEVTNTESVEIRMPQMANRALSESWLFKYLGDKHWLLLSEGFNKNHPNSKTKTGNRM